MFLHTHNLPEGGMDRYYYEADSDLRCSGGVPAAHSVTREGDTLTSWEL